MQAARLDTYWRLDDFNGIPNRELVRRLRAQGYKPNYDPVKRDLVQLLQRGPRGLICYQKWSIEELRDICRNRGIRPLMTKNQLLFARYLMARDSDIVFGKLLDLPVELRNKIYEYHLNGFADFLDSPTQPPISRVNRQIRSEVLPMFYSKCSIAIACRCSVTEKRVRLNLAMRSHGFLTSIDPLHLSWIRSFRINVRLARKMDEPGEEEAQITLDRTGNTFKPRIYRPPEHWRFRRKREYTTERCQRVLDEQTAQQAGLSLGLVLALRQDLEQALR